MHRKDVSLLRVCQLRLEHDLTYMAVFQSAEGTSAQPLNPEMHLPSIQVREGRGCQPLLSHLKRPLPRHLARLGRRYVCDHTIDFSIPLFSEHLHSRKYRSTWKLVTCFFRTLALHLRNRCLPRSFRSLCRRLPTLFGKQRSTYSLVQLFSTSSSERRRMEA